MGDKQKALADKGRLGTFTIQIQYRENATWQGKILWVEEKQSNHFRSALEMIKLIESALDKAEGKEEKSGGE